MSITLSENPSKKMAGDASTNKFLVMILVFVVCALSIGMLGVGIFAKSIWTTYHEDDRITYVKLDPNGNWTIERSDRQMDDFFHATVDAGITRLIQKCLSNNPATIHNDWAVCTTFLSDKKLKKFFKNRYVPEDVDFNDYVTEHMQCDGCEWIEFKVRDIDHKNSIPTSFKDVYGLDVQIFESLIYGTFISTNGDEKKAVVDLKWSFVTSKSKRTFGELLVENPLGIYFVDFFDVEDH